MGILKKYFLFMIWAFHRKKFAQKLSIVERGYACA
jgi:hypothetical protein